MYRYFTYFILLGSILTLGYFSMQDALSVMYSSTAEQRSFGLFFLIMSLIVTAIGMFFQWVVPLRWTLIKLDVYGPAIIMIAAVIVGNVFGHMLKTDEFLFYFILTHLVTMYAALATARQIVSLYKRGVLPIYEIPHTVIGIAVGVALIHSLHFLISDFVFFTGIWNLYLALLLSKITIDWYKNLYNVRLTRSA